MPARGRPPRDSPGSAGSTVPPHTASLCASCSPWCSTGHAGIPGGDRWGQSGEVLPLRGTTGSSALPAAPRLHTNLCRAAVTSLSRLHNLVATHGNFIRRVQSWSVQQALPFPGGDETLELFYAAVAEDFHPICESARRRTGLLSPRAAFWAVWLLLPTEGVGNMGWLPPTAPRSCPLCPWTRPLLCGVTQTGTAHTRRDQVSGAIASAPARAPRVREPYSDLFCITQAATAQRQPRGFSYAMPRLRPSSRATMTAKVSSVAVLWYCRGQGPPQPVSPPCPGTFPRALLGAGAPAPTAPAPGCSGHLRGLAGGSAPTRRSLRCRGHRGAPHLWAREVTGTDRQTAQCTVPRQPLQPGF